MEGCVKSEISEKRVAYLAFLAYLAGRGKHNELSGNDKAPPGQAGE